MLLAKLSAEPAGGNSAENIKKPDHGDGSRGEHRWQVMIGQKGRQMSGDKSDMKPADKKTTAQQPITRMAGCFIQSLTQTVGRPAIPRASPFDAKREGNDQCGDNGHD